MKHKYRIAPTSAFPRGKTSKFLNAEIRQTEHSGTIRDDPKPSSRFQVDVELARMRSITAQQAAAVAAQAVAEAEAAMAEAEAAAREAEAAEAEAEVAQAFVEAVTLTMKNKSTSNLVMLSTANILFSFYSTYLVLVKATKDCQLTTNSIVA